ncbi:hypothetical protein I312_102002 [Cryptococcus bacillisporus CA1280]|uniref:Vacuolar protein sorting-associated protein 51 homolog n=2 Tax=Cryptococcus gattii TaxID=552467 RepID=A0A0D0VU64_CRYGA|nr:hypothetical protein I312_02045 [Cryptococcus bacillisporus CA1280]KIR67800.1 hypothetical protein I314_02217 [Cryptococcus bacillisporus CA1873]|eukprot:KIR67800.1 hypothetical protein I314_02217 [Cryptococcus gattii CA1873]
MAQTTSGQNPPPYFVSSPSSAKSTLEQRRTRREQFRNFYGLKSDAAAETEGVNDSKLVDIDSPAFKPAAYYEDLTAKSTLSGLMTTTASLSSDIGTLQGARHSLVYNHHHQLFAAGDTISQLNVRTPQLLSVVTNLQQSFSSISQLVDSINLPRIEEQVIVDPEEATTISRRKAQRQLERLQLMVQANESSDRINEFYKINYEALHHLAAENNLAKKHLEDYEAAIRQTSGIVPT